MIKEKNIDLSKIIAIGIYSLIAIALRYFFAIYKPDFLASISKSLVYTILTGIGPLIGAWVVILVLKRKTNYSNFGVSVKKSTLSVFIPIFLFFIYDLIIKNHLFSNTLIVITCLIYAYCEEFGWRGYLQSELIHLSKFARILIITIIWFVWHLNFSVDLGNILFLLILFFGSWIVGQIAINTKSIVACACFHAVVTILYSLKMNVATISLITISVISWLMLWYLKKSVNKQHI